MAHSDIFIFLNTITWVFFLFLLVYFFFVLFFLPTLYKKLRLRSLVREVYIRKLLVEAFDSFSSAYVSSENFKLFAADLNAVILYFFNKNFNFTPTFFLHKNLLINFTGYPLADSASKDFFVRFFFVGSLVTLDGCFLVHHQIDR